MFSSIIDNSGLTLFSISVIIISRIVLGLLISYVHMRSSRYSKNFIITLSILPLLVASVMLMVNGNLGTGVAIAGAFSLVRFRSISGTSREIISVFFAMAVGIAIGMGQIVFAIMITFIVCLFLFIFYTTSFGESKKNSKILEIQIPENLEYENVFSDIFNEYVDKYELLKVKTANLGSLYELKYQIEIKRNASEKEFIDELRIRNGNLKICLHLDNMEEML